MSFFYNINLFLNLIKYTILKKFKKNDSEHFSFLKNYYKEKKMVSILMLAAIIQ